MTVCTWPLYLLVLTYTVPLRSQLGEDSLWRWDVILHDEVYTLNQLKWCGSMSRVDKLSGYKIQGGRETHILSSQVAPLGNLCFLFQQLQVIWSEGHSKCLIEFTAAGAGGRGKNLQPGLLFGHFVPLMPRDLGTRNQSTGRDNWPKSWEGDKAAVIERGGEEYVCHLVTRGETLGPPLWLWGVSAQVLLLKPKKCMVNWDSAASSRPGAVRRAAVHSSTFLSCLTRKGIQPQP